MVDSSGPSAEQQAPGSGLADALANFEKRWTGAYLEGWKSYWGIVADLAGNPGSLPQKGPEAYSKLVDAGAQYYRAVLDAGVELATRLYKTSEPTIETAAAAAPASTSPPAPNKPPTEMDFEGPAGAKPARQFRIANKTAGPIEVSFEISELFSDEGDHMRLEAELTPVSFSFQPGEERVVECRVTVSSTLVEDRPYRAILRAIGLPDMQAVLRVTRLAEQLSPADSAA